MRGRVPRRAPAVPPSAVLRPYGGRFLPRLERESESEMRKNSEAAKDRSRTLRSQRRAKSALLLMILLDDRQPIERRL